MKKVYGDNLLIMRLSYENIIIFQSTYNSQHLINNNDPKQIKVKTA